MHTDIYYTDADRKARDRQALLDVLDFWSNRPNYRRLFRDMILWAQSLPADDPNSFYKVSMMMEISGVQGYPILAFGRRYCLETLRSYMERGPGRKIQLDAEGFPIHSG